MFRLEEAFPAANISGMRMGISNCPGKDLPVPHHRIKSGIMRRGIDGKRTPWENQHHLHGRCWESNPIPKMGWENGMEGLPGRNLLEGNCSGIEATFYPAGEGG